MCDLPDEKGEPAFSLLHRLQKDNDPYPDDPLLSGKFNEETLEAFRELESGGGQQYSAERIGIRQSNISRLESGNYNPSLVFLKKVAEGLGKELHVEFR